MSQNPTNAQTPLAVSIRTMGQDLAAIQKGQTPLPRVETVSAGPPEALPVERLSQLPRPLPPPPPTARPVTPPAPTRPAAPAQLESVLAPKTLLPQRPPAPPQPLQKPFTLKPTPPHLPVPKPPVAAQLGMLKPPAPPTPVVTATPPAVSSILEAKIQTDLQNAVKRQDALVTSVLRLLLAAIHNALLLAAIHNAEIATHKGPAGLNDNEIRAVVAAEVRRRKEAIEGYEHGGRGELVEKERTELAVLYHYLPTPPTPPATQKPPTAGPPAPPRPAAPLTQPVGPAFSPPPQPPHPIIPPPPAAAPKPAMSPVTPPTPKPPTAPQPAQPQPAAPRAPTLGANRQKLILASSAVAVVVLAAAGGALWWFKFRPPTVTPPPPPPIVEPAEPTPIVTNMAVLRIEANAPAGIPAAVTSAWSNNGRGGVFDTAFVKIVPPDGARRYATAADIIASYPLRIPAVIREDITGLNLLRFTQTEFLTPSRGSLLPDRFGIAITFAAAPHPETILTWENTMVSDLESYLDLSRFNAGPDLSSWRDSTYREIAVRYMNFALPDQSFDYAFLPAKNLLLIATSRESMYALIDAVLNQNGIE